MVASHIILEFQSFLLHSLKNLPTQNAYIDLKGDLKDTILKAILKVI